MSGDTSGLYLEQDLQYAVSLELLSVTVGLREGVGLETLDSSIQ